jgi:hypothetical protein
MDEVERNIQLLIRLASDADALITRVRRSAVQVHDWVAGFRGDPLDMLKRMTSPLRRAGIPRHFVAHFEADVCSY